MMIVIYQIYQLNCIVFKDKLDGFEDAETKEKGKIPVQNMAGIDDTNAINTLAQISRQLMAGGLTVPGDMIVQGNIKINFGSNTGSKITPQLLTDGKSLIVNDAPLVVNQNLTVGGGLTVGGVLSPAHSVWHTSTDGKPRLHYGNNSHTYYRTADAHFWRNRDDQDKMVLDHGGVLTVAGRNILAELNALNEYTNQLKSRITFPNGNLHFNMEGMIVTNGHNANVDRPFHAGYNWAHAVS